MKIERKQEAEDKWREREASADLMMSSISRLQCEALGAWCHSQHECPCLILLSLRPTAGRFNCVALTFPWSPWQPCGQRGEVTAARLLLTRRAGTNDDEEDEDEEWIIRAHSQHWLVATAKLQGLLCQVYSAFGNLSACVCVWTCQAREQRAKLKRQFDWTARGTITT